MREKSLHAVTFVAMINRESMPRYNSRPRGGQSLTVGAYAKLVKGDASCATRKNVGTSPAFGEALDPRT